MSEVGIPATALAREISAKFDCLMAKGGRIDQILAGGEIERKPALPAAETERLLKNLEISVIEYRDEMAAALAWHKAWKRRQQPKGFRITAAE